MEYGTPEDSRLPQTGHGGWPPLSVAQDPLPHLSCFKGRPGANYCLIAAYLICIWSFILMSCRTVLVAWATGSWGLIPPFHCLPSSLPAVTESHTRLPHRYIVMELLPVTPRCSPLSPPPSGFLHSLRQLSFNFHVICI